MADAALWVVLAHLPVAAAAAASARRLRQRAFLVAALAPLLTFVWIVAVAPGVIDDGAVSGSFEWAPTVGFELAWRIDVFAVVMVGLVSGIGVGVFTYAASYFGPREGLDRLSGLLVLFAGSMTGLVLSDNVMALFLFWEMTSITSYLLIGIDDQSAPARAAAQRALITTAGGGLAMLAGFVLLGQVSGTYTLSEILATAPEGRLVEVALVLVLLGALTKSAQFPFHFWLPGAMAAPTPVSAYLHSATMVKAGVYLIARLAPAFGDAAVWRPIVLTAGAATMILGGVNAMRQVDLKLLLAHGTVSQLGFMVVLFGMGWDEATLAGVAILIAHALFKAALFLVVGAVDHQAGTRDLRRLHRLARAVPLLTGIAVVAAASMAGLPPLFGFVAKESAIEALLHGREETWSIAVLGAVVVGSAITVAYSTRFVWGAFGPASPATPIEDRVTTVERPGVGLVLPSLVLAVATVVAGVFPFVVTRLVVDGARALDPLVGDVKLSLWHGVNLALGLSVLAWVVGAGLWWLAHRARRRRAPRAIGAAAFDAGLRGVLRGAETVTGAIQTGSLPLYMLVILGTVLFVPVVPLLFEAPTFSDDIVLADRPMQLAAAAMIVVATLAVVKARSRLAAAITVGAVGYAVAALFVLQGAPDLALTQVMVETLLLVIFVLVLRHLPANFDTVGTAVRKVPRLAVSIGSGVVVGVMTLVAASARTQPSVGEQHLQQALPDAEGLNAVNVILVDFRAFDTFGEITVVTVATLGTMGLVRSARRERQRRHDAPPAQRFRRSPALDAAARVLFHTLLLFSVVLLSVGHNSPGGGFIAGLVAGAAFVLVFLAGGATDVRRSVPVSAEAMLGWGITLAALAGAWGIAAGGEFLGRASAGATLPLVGTLKLTSAFVFDLGVYLVVTGLTVGILRSLGREEVRAA